MITFRGRRKAVPVLTGDDLRQRNQAAIAAKDLPTGGETASDEPARPPRESMFEPLADKLHPRPNLGGAAAEVGGSTQADRERMAAFEFAERVRNIFSSDPLRWPRLRAADTWDRWVHPSGTKPQDGLELVLTLCEQQYRATGRVPTDGEIVATMDKAESVLPATETRAQARGRALRRIAGAARHIK